MTWLGAQVVCDEYTVNAYYDALQYAKYSCVAEDEAFSVPVGGDVKLSCDVGFVF